MAAGTLDHIDELLPGYMLDVADEAERARVEDHLPRCPRCRTLLDEYAESVHALALLAPTQAPPLGVKAAVLRGVQEVQPARRRLDPLWVAGAGVAASLVAALALGVGIALVQVRGDLQESRVEIARLEEVLRQDRQLTYLAASPETQVIVLKPTREGDRGYAMLMVPSSDRFALLVGGNMTNPGPGRAYQVWMTVADQRVSGGTFTVDESGWGRIRVQPPAPLVEVQRVGVTVEPAQGSLEPTSPPVLVWTRP